MVQAGGVWVLRQESIYRIFPQQDSHFDVFSQKREFVIILGNERGMKKKLSTFYRFFPLEIPMGRVCQSVV